MYKSKQEDDPFKRQSQEGCVFEEGERRGEGGVGGVDILMQTMLLGQTEGERKAFLGRCKKGSHIVRLPPRALGCHKKRKSLSFCEI